MCGVLRLFVIPFCLSAGLWVLILELLFVRVLRASPDLVVFVVPVGCFVDLCSVMFLRVDYCVWCFTVSLI